MTEMKNNKEPHNTPHGEDAFFPKGAIVFFSLVISTMVLVWCFAYLLMLLRA